VAVAGAEEDTPVHHQRRSGKAVAAGFCGSRPDQTSVGSIQGVHACAGTRSGQDHAVVFDGWRMQQWPWRGEAPKWRAGGEVECVEVASVRRHEDPPTGHNGFHSRADAFPGEGHGPLQVQGRREHFRGEGGSLGIAAQLGPIGQHRHSAGQASNHR
jgi:hypothetical protein